MSNDKDKPKKQPNDLNDMTPWQQANLEYLKKLDEEKQKSLDDEKTTSENEKPTEESEPAGTDSPNDHESLEPIENEEDFEDLEMFEDHSGGPANGSFLDRLPNIRHERYRRLYRRSTFLVLLFALPSIFLLYYISPLSKLADVTITGNEQVSAQEIKKDLDFSIGENLWQQYFQRNEYIAQLKKQELRIKDATIRFNGANKFEVDVKEYHEVAYLEHDDKYSPVLPNGKIIPLNMDQAKGGLPILEGFTGPGRILSVLKQYDQLSEEVRQGVSQIKYAPSEENEELLQIFMNDGNQVLVSIPEMSKKMYYYPQIVKEMDAADFKGVVDMEAGIYSYPYPEETSDSGSIQESTEETVPSTEND
ncbi:cell division protein DivIB [Enterococcus florum]|uniref:Cell division protein DivIB n=1 Tax=Enterococcus florum TaxID=2480627 RepID=A0A4P5P8V2_9ENTE|nr:cell division protein FtsQ/DivIB [Enterococcus florum]GCF93966.1 cell division protein DivIB [Enterococcus florum]